MARVQLAFTCRRRWWVLPVVRAHTYWLIIRMALFGLPLSSAEEKISHFCERIARKGLIVSASSAME